MAEQGVDMIGPLPKANPTGGQRQRGVSEQFDLDKFSYEAKQDIYRCPAGENLRHKGRAFGPGVVIHKYTAKIETCAVCQFRSQCCPGMESEAAKATYRQRGPVAEFPNAWIKDKLGLRQFRLRGLIKVRLEVLWATLT